MKKKVGILIGVLLIAMSFTVFAGSTYSGYSVKVPKFNGSGYTSYQTKITIGAAAGLRSTSTGGYNMDVRMKDAQGYSGDWTRNVNDSGTWAVDGSAYHKNGDRVRLQFSNDITTTKDLTAKGTWRSN